MSVLRGRRVRHAVAHTLIEPRRAMVAKMTPGGVSDAAIAVGLPLHDHDWRLREVWHEDGYATEEYACAGCRGVTFR